MNKEIKVHVETLLFALAFTGAIIGFGLGPIQVQAYSDGEDNKLNIWGLGQVWGQLNLHTQSYNDGSDLGTVVASQTSWAWWPLVTYHNGVGVTEVDSNTKLAWGDFGVVSMLLWLLPIYSQTFTIYTEVTYTHPDDFSYYKYWV